MTTPVIVDQRGLSGNARSTVGTITDIYSMMRVLFARFGEPSSGLPSLYSFNDPKGMCPECEGLGQSLSTLSGGERQRIKLADQLPTPDPALKRLEKLVGTWELKGRTLHSKEDNITGWTTFEWMPGGFFLQSVGEITFNGSLIHSLELITYDPERKTFPSSVYSNLSGTVLSYEWDIQGNTVIHSGLGSKYTGTFSEDGTMLSGGWRPDEGTKSTDGNAYDAVMTRIK